MKHTSKIAYLFGYSAYDHVHSSFGSIMKTILLVTSHTAHITTGLNVKFVTNSNALVEDKAKYRLH